MRTFAAAFAFILIGATVVLFPVKQEGVIQNVRWGRDSFGHRIAVSKHSLAYVDIVSMGPVWRLSTRDPSQLGTLLLSPSLEYLQQFQDQALNSTKSVPTPSWRLGGAVELSTDTVPDDPSSPYQLLLVRNVERIGNGGATYGPWEVAVVPWLVFVMIPSAVLAAVVVMVLRAYAMWKSRSRERPLKQLF